MAARNRLDQCDQRQRDQRKYPAPLISPLARNDGGKGDGILVASSKRPGCGPADPGRKRSSHVTYVIAQPCVDVLDRACIEECPVDCIYEGERMLYIHPDECVDCGACEPVCPVEAIYYEDDVPDQWKDYYKVNVDFFEELGSPGGASKTGKIGKDHPLVAALPPQGEGS
jgi:ferredoxin